jgi:hypothetical protein
MKYCTNCVYPLVAATPLTVDENGVCSSCRVSRQKPVIDWAERRRMLQELVDEYRTPHNYDIIIPVSGGKDSYFQTHVVVKELGLKPLLVTYDGYNYMRGIYLSNYVNWEANDHAQLVMKQYGWRPAQQPFERTYRMFSNLDDQHENGIHDYLKFVKLGYGRGSDHACKDIRAGLMTRDQGIEVVRKYDAVKPRRDLDRWLEYVGMSEAEFDATCDTFRDRRVWRMKDGRWFKDNIWGGESDYGPVHAEPRTK